MRDWPVHVIPNTLNLNRFQPLDKNLCRRVLNLPPDIPLLAFGALGGVVDPRKGFALLAAALETLTDSCTLKEAECVVFGQSEP
jgi:hypothetical protein